MNPIEVVGDSPYLLTAEAARFLKFDRRGDGTERPIADAMRLFREWAARNHVPVRHRGRTLLYDRRVLAACLEVHTGNSTRHVRRRHHTKVEEKRSA